MRVIISWIGKRLSHFFAGALRLLAGAIIALNIAHVAIAQPLDVTEAEMSLIPQYCRVAMAEGAQLSPPYVAYVNRYGRGFRSVHHYCWGQIRWMRALRSSTPTVTRDFLLGNVSADYTYVLIHSPDSFILLPEVYTRLGEVELRRSLPDKANAAFAKARALKRDYWPAYSHWAEFLMQSGRHAEATKLVQEGLRYSPNSRVLKSQLQALGAKASATVRRDREEESPRDEAAAGAADEAGSPDKPTAGGPPPASAVK